jgi:inorganic pyrophosphatase
MSVVDCYIEIKKNSNMKYEFDKEQKKLVLDRILTHPYQYPFAYGFIPDTLGNDGDDLDIVVITDKELQNGETVKGYIIGGLMMEDEHGMDEKLFIVLEDEYSYLSDIKEMNSIDTYNLVQFFSNYKNQDKDKWSKVHGLMTKEEANNLYETCRLKTNLN